MTSLRAVKMTSGIERERNAEREHDLREDERARRVDADRDHDERGDHRDEPPDRDAGSGGG